MKYSQAINAAVAEKMRADGNVFICGLGVPDPKGVFGSTAGLVEEFGERRVFDTPASENGTLGMLVGASLQGLRPVMVNQRVDFILLALDQIINHAAKWKWMFGNAQRVPITIRLIVGRGWGQGPQHSQSMHGLFAGIPGLKVVTPATPKDAKGLLISAIEDDDPVIFIEHRRLYDMDEAVPEGLYRVPIGKAAVIQPGEDVTVVGISQMSAEARKAGEALAQVGVSAEIIDLRSLRPLDDDTVCRSVKKTGRLVIVDADWRSCGVAGELIARVNEKCFGALRCAPVRLTWPEMPAPTSEALEPLFYPNAQQIFAVCLRCCERAEEAYPLAEKKVVAFHGPF